MELHLKTMDNLIEYLVEHGYPKDSLATEYKIGKYRVDLAVIDPRSKLPIQLFEIKANKSNYLRKMGKEQLQNYQKLINNDYVPTFLVFPKESHPGFEIEPIKFDQDDESSTAEAQTVIQSLSGNINFTGNRNGRLSEKIENTKIEKKKTINTLSVLCWISSTLVIILGILNYLKVLALNATDLTLIGVVLALLLIPFASKLKVLGIEFERNKENEEPK